MNTLLESLSYTPTELGFGTSGLRGLVTDMTDLECYINARGFLKFLTEHDGLAPASIISVGGDLRKSTPRIISAVVRAIQDAGHTPQYCGLLPTPALAYWAQNHDQACIMVTGSHIPDDRNGIKFYKVSGEVLKSDEASIKSSVASIRAELYQSEPTAFNPDGSLIVRPDLQDFPSEVAQQYLDRFQSVLSAGLLSGKHVVVYQHSAVGRDLLVQLLESLGAAVTPVDRSETFISIDTENVTPEDRAYFKGLAEKYPDAFAIVSTDGDSDRPFVIDENGEFHRGDVLGYIVAKELGTDFAALPVSSSDAVDTSLNLDNTPWVHTKIGSPYVIEAMQTAIADGSTAPVGWEVNGGFLTGADIIYGEGTLRELPTRDAFLPIVITLAAALKQSVPISRLFANLPQRFTQAGLIDNFPQEDSQKIIAVLANQDETAHKLIRECFTAEDSFGEASTINTTDGIRITFKSGEVAHIRPSGNAPQLRIYSVADSQQRADEIVALGLKEDGILRKLQSLV